MLCRYSYFFVSSVTNCTVQAPHPCNLHSRVKQCCVSCTAVTALLLATAPFCVQQCARHHPSRTRVTCIHSRVQCCVSCNRFTTRSCTPYTSFLCPAVLRRVCPAHPVSHPCNLHVIHVGIVTLSCVMFYVLVSRFGVMTCTKNHPCTGFEFPF